MTRIYPLEIENVGTDIYTLMSRGHHDLDAFMRQVRADGYEWPLGMPKHIWLRCIPPSDGYVTWYVEAQAGARGAFPATQCWESQGSDTYEAIRATALAASQETAEVAP